jgi:hypothetical protein
MSLVARSLLTTAANSCQTGRDAAKQLSKSLEAPPSLLLVYLTVNHDQAGFLSGLREGFGASIPTIGCSVQGIIGPGSVQEDGYGAGVMALGGQDLAITSACVEEIGTDTLEKGQTLGRQLRSGLSGSPRVAVLHWDPLCWADVDCLLQGLQQELDCPVVGGAASHAFYQALGQTYQYSGERVLSGAAVAFVMGGSQSVELDICHGCSPVGLGMTVTKARGNVLLELDGRRAYDVLAEMCALDSQGNPRLTALAIGIPGESSSGDHDYLVRAVYHINIEDGGVQLGSSIPEGTRIMLHHRTVQDVLQGAERMAKALRARVQGKTVRAVLGFECGARTGPFLGQQATLEENLLLQREIGQDAAWMGAMFWGELFPVGSRAAFHNYSYPILAIAD